ncbi:MAG: hypothetical protein A4E28_00530 [Methanocella sp. PtaU1.Bin125]|nr:MAG: hypothetical protein A4E28_00530 [Methanocella sp. PtaU1.Bin125]
MIVKGNEMERAAVDQVAALMCAAARTAPKARGTDNLSTLVITGSDIKKVSAEMRRVAEESDVAFFARDAANVDASLALVVLGQKTVQLNIPVCGFCGFDSCADNARAGAACAISAGDLGIATLAAAAVAGLHHVDNRIMFSIGRAALNLGLFGDEKVTMAYGIPLSVTGKSPYFDRK